MALALTTKNPDEVERIALFSIDGVEYTIPKKVRTDVQLKFMRLNRENPDDAAAWLLETVLGTEAYGALESYPDLTPEDLQHVLFAALRVVFGMTEDETTGKAS